MTFDATDLSAIFGDDMPGYALASIGASNVPGLLMNTYSEGFGMVGGTQPVLRCASADVSAVVEGTAITINSVAYTARAVEPDGTGITLIRLEKAS